MVNREDLGSIEQSCNLFQFTIHLLYHAIGLGPLAIRTDRSIVKMEALRIIWCPISEILYSLCAIGQIRIDLES